MPIEGNQTLFLRRHASTIATLELSSTEDVQLVGSAEADTPVPFPSLHSLRGDIAYGDAGRLLGMIQGVVLVHVNIRIDGLVRPQYVLNFFEGASASLETAVVSSLSFGDSEDPFNPHDPRPRLNFQRLKTYTSRCRIGDMVVSAIKEAPLLLELTLRGNPNLLEIKEEVRFLRTVIPPACSSCPV